MSTKKTGQDTGRTSGSGPSVTNDDSKATVRILNERRGGNVGTRTTTTKTDTNQGQKKKTK